MMYHRRNLQSTLPVLVVLSGYVAVRAAHVAPWHLLSDASLAQTAEAATRAVKKASSRILIVDVAQFSEYYVL
jgi:hypothetical protein